MKNYLITIILTAMLLSLLSARHFAEGDYMIYRNDGVVKTVIEMAEELVKNQVVFFGEYHDDVICHALEMELLTELYEINPNLVVSFEMFERDVQSAMDNYLSGKITEAEFLENSRPWPNYEKDYRPLVEFAKMNKLPVIAANVPRKYAAMIAKNGIAALDSLPDIEKNYVAEKLKVLDDEYKDNFFSTITKGKFGNDENGAPQVLLEKMYAAQCLKDDTMAESIFRALKNNPEAIVIHFNGDFHSRKHLGTAQKLNLFTPKVRIAIIAPAYIDSQTAFKWDESLQKEADYLILIHKMTDDKSEK